MGCAGAMTVLLKDALKPNLIQTLEGQPCFMHIGPFGNIAHGNSSIVADLVGRKLGDYVITEAGFGSDLGMQKFMDIVCRAGGFAPSAVVIVATAKALKHHAGLEDDPRNSAAENLKAIETGSANLARHIQNVKHFGLPCVVAANRFPGDTDDEVALVQKLALDHGAHAAVLNEGFSKGGAGAAGMAEAVADACEQPNTFHFTFDDSDPIATKIEKIATAGVPGRRRRLLRRWRSRRSSSSPATASAASRSAWPSRTCRSRPIPALANAPTGFRIPVRDIRPYTGAGFLTPALRRHHADARPGQDRRPGSTWTSTRTERRLDSSSDASTAQRPRRPYLTATVADFLEQLAARTPAPGGGAVAAVVCAMAAGLVEMAAAFDSGGQLDGVGERAHALRGRVADLAAADARAYGEVLEALRMPAGPDRTRRLDAAVSGRDRVPDAGARDRRRGGDARGRRRGAGQSQPRGRRDHGRAPGRGGGSLGGHARPAEREHALPPCRRRRSPGAPAARAGLRDPRPRAGGRGLRARRARLSPFARTRSAQAEPAIGRRQRGEIAVAAAVRQRRPGRQAPHDQHTRTARIGAPRDRRRGRTRCGARDRDRERSDLDALGRVPGDRGVRRVRRSAPALVRR